MLDKTRIYKVKTGVGFEEVHETEHVPRKEQSNQKTMGPAVMYSQSGLIKTTFHRRTDGMYDTKTEYDW